MVALFDALEPRVEQVVAEGSGPKLFYKRERSAKFLIRKTVFAAMRKECFS